MVDVKFYKFVAQEACTIFQKECMHTRVHTAFPVIPCESIKRPTFEKVLLHEYQSNDIEKCLVLSPVCQIRFSNVLGFNRSFLPVEIGDFLQKAPFGNLQKRVKRQARFPFVR